MAARLPLLQPSLKDPISAKRATDRTVGPIRRWRVLTENLPMIRMQTMTTLEATEGKSGAVTLRVCDREKFDALQKTIKDYQEQIAVLEEGIRKLDAIGADLWIDDLQSRLSSLAATKAQQRKVLATWANAAISKPVYRGLTPEEILGKDELYLHHKQLCEAQISKAKAEYDALLPVVEKTEEVLGSLQAAQAGR